MSIELGGILIATARGAIARKLGLHYGAAPEHAALMTPGASFVTLTQQGKLRGCIGSLETYRRLGDDVRENAVAAAFHDPRFVPLQGGELSITCIEISLLSVAEPMQVESEADALAQLRPAIDGVIFMHNDRRATFLPQVWKSLPQPRQFMAQLKRKAGLPVDFWDEQVRLARYAVTKYTEPQLT